MIDSILANLFTTAMNLGGGQRFMLMLPLCLSVAIVYKTTRCDSLREVPVAALVLWVTILLGMYTVGFGLWAIFSLLV